MKKIFLAMAVIGGCSLSIYSENVRIMTYNIRNGVGMDNKRDLSRVGSCIKSQGADIVAIQELDSLTRRSGGKYVLGELAILTEMTPYYAPAINYDGGKYGIGFLSKKQPVNVKQIALPGREESRTMLILEFDDYAMGCLHLSLTPEDALASVEKIENEAKNLFPKPFVIMGDFNSHPDSEVIKKLSSTFQNLGDLSINTYPADEPDERIDYILVANLPEIKVGNTMVVEENVASDHRPIVTEISFPGREK